jgi:hypothetical protein
MNKDLVNGVLATVVVAVLGIVLLYLGAQGALPMGFGLFNMDSIAVRAVLFVVLAVVAVVLYMAYRRQQSSS